MTQTANLFLMEIQGLCILYGVDPWVALENETVRLAIKTKNIEEVRKAFEAAF
jgi:hydrogenase maturation factor